MIQLVDRSAKVDAKAGVQSFSGPTTHVAIDRTGNVIHLKVDPADRQYLMRKRAQGWVCVNGLEEPLELMAGGDMAAARREIDRRIDATKVDTTEGVMTLRELIARRKAQHAEELAERERNKGQSRAEKRAAEQLVRVISAAQAAMAQPQAKAPPPQASADQEPGEPKGKGK